MSDFFIGEKAFWHSIKEYWNTSQNIKSAHRIRLLSKQVLPLILEPVNTLRQNSVFESPEGDFPVEHEFRYKAVEVIADSYDS